MSYIIFDDQDPEVLMLLSETSNAWHRRIPRPLWLKARTRLQHLGRIMVWSRQCAECGQIVLKAQMPGPLQRVCRGCWHTYMDNVSCNEWVKLREIL